VSGIADQKYLLNKQYQNSSNLQARIDLHAHYALSIKYRCMEPYISRKTADSP